MRPGAQATTTTTQLVALDPATRLIANIIPAISVVVTHTFVVVISSNIAVSNVKNVPRCCSLLHCQLNGTLVAPYTRT